MTDNVFPEDSGTGGYSAGDGDFDEAANFASLADAVGLTDYVVEGLNFTLDAGTPSLDISQGKAVVTQSSTTGAKSGETRDNGVAFVAELDARTGLSLTDGDVNHVFLSVDLTSADTINIIINTTNSAPSQPYVKLGTVDTTNDTTTELNRLIPIALADLQSKDHSELTGITSSQHHAKYTDEEAQDAVGTILSNDFSYDDANDLIDLASNQVTVAGNTVALGGSTAVNHSDLSNIGTDDHHTRPTPGQGMVENSGAFDVRLDIDDSGTDVATAYGVNFGSDLSASDDGDNTVTVSLTNNSVTVAGNTVSLGGSTAVDHADLSNITSDDHHVRPSAGEGLEESSNTFSTEETVAYETGMVNWGSGLSNAEIHRIALQTGETLVIDRIEVRQQGGGSSSNFSVRVQDLTAASTVGSQNLGGTTKNPGSSGSGNTVAVQLSNSTGGAINASVRVIGRIQGA